ncbi:hypothetical protein [Flammeovirga sp. SJP92]|uniref:hypothetical protein n=1 Tax=Flammeovirga sp. SJP92 TaxID=1775430 RepID=UPI0007891416|nr:hypothetical protein [Flammeovirga sp. SJP92]KXX69171.1 hypothetical protein AVL50_16750 [Flammeovirga sp. SJP92]
MPGIKCKCGNVIKFGEIPNSNEWLFISDVEYDKYSGNVDSEKLYMDLKSMLICQKCKRIWIYWNGYDNAPTPYKLDVDN